MAWSKEDTDFLIQHYPDMGQKYCAQILNKSLPSIRMKTSRLGLFQNRNSDFFKDWQYRAAKSKIGKKRPDQALVMKRLHKEGKLIKTEAQIVACYTRLKNFIAKNGHPRGMLGKKQTKEHKEMQRQMSKKRWDEMPEEKKMAIRIKSLKTRVLNGTYAAPRKGGSWKAAWRTIGGKEKYYRSRWEANYARYLEFLIAKGEIKEWLHEPDVFWFDGIKRGCVSYLPDFKVTNNDDSVEYHEVKGWMDAASKTKIRRMKKYHPTIKLIVIAQKEYNEIKMKLSRLIKDWE